MLLGRGSIPNILFFSNWQTVFCSLTAMTAMACRHDNCQLSIFKVSPTRHAQNLTASKALRTVVAVCWRMCFLLSTVYSIPWHLPWLGKWSQFDYTTVFGKWMAPWLTCEALPTSSTAWYCQELSFASQRKPWDIWIQCCSTESRWASSKTSLYVSWRSCVIRGLRKGKPESRKPIA